MRFTHSAAMLRRTPISNLRLRGNMTVLLSGRIRCRRYPNLWCSFNSSLQMYVQASGNENAHCNFTILFSSGIVMSLDPNSTPSYMRVPAAREMFVYVHNILYTPLDRDSRESADLSGGPVEMTCRRRRPLGYSLRVRLKHQNKPQEAYQ